MGDAYPWAPVDPLGEALHFLRMSGTFYCRVEVTAPFGLVMPAFDGCPSFHVVTAGGCWLDMDGSEPLFLGPGDLALVPRGEGHRMSSAPRGAEPSGRVDTLPQEAISERYTVLRHGGGGEPSSLVCGIVRFEHPAARRLVALLPQVIHVRAGSASHAWIESTLAMMAAEAQTMRPGGEAVITRLADILVIQAIRSWMETDPAARTGWLGALRHEQIGRALMRIHRDPARAWTVASLASAAAMSRSAFSAHFTELVGEPVMHYVARWRMHVAHSWLAEDGIPLAEVGRRLGYRSEAAFSRAFKRFLGMSPGAVRRSARV